MKHPVWKCVLRIVWAIASLLGLLESSGKIHSSHKLNQGPIIWETLHNEHMDDWKERDCGRQ